MLNTLARRYQIPVVLLLFILSACGTAPERAPGVTQQAPPELSAKVVASPAYAVDVNESAVHILVRRAGLLASFGHNHVISAPVHGVIHAGDDVDSSGFDLFIRPTEFLVDTETARQAAGKEFGAAVSDEDRLGTWRNMLGKRVLASDDYPEIRLRSLRLAEPMQQPSVLAALTLRGVTRELEFPAEVKRRDNALQVTATFTVRQTDFGMEPFSAFGGGLSVADELELHVDLLARRE